VNNLNYQHCNNNRHSRCSIITTIIVIILIQFGSILYHFTPQVSQTILFTITRIRTTTITIVITLVTVLWTTITTTQTFPTLPNNNSSKTNTSVQITTYKKKNQFKDNLEHLSCTHKATILIQYHNNLPMFFSNHCLLINLITTPTNLQIISTTKITTTTTQGMLISIKFLNTTQKHKNNLTKLLDHLLFRRMQVELLNNQLKSNNNNK